MNVESWSPMTREMTMKRGKNLIPTGKAKTWLRKFIQTWDFPPIDMTAQHN